MTLRKERKAARLTQVELSELSGVRQSTISKLEGIRPVRPSFDTLARLAGALNKRGRRVTAEDLAPKAPLLIKGARALPHRHTAKRKRIA